GRVVGAGDGAGGAGRDVALDAAATGQDPAAGRAAGASSAGLDAAARRAGRDRRPLLGGHRNGAVLRDRERPGMTVDAAGRTVAPADLERHRVAVAGLG